MNKALSIFAITAVLAGGSPDLALAQDTASDQERIRYLEQQLRERDQLLLEMVERLEAVENRLGLEPLRVSDSSRQQAEAEQPVASAPGTVVVDASLAERALERSLSREGALLLPAGVLEIEPGLYLSRFEDSNPALIETEDGIVIGENQLGINSAVADLGLRLGLPASSQLELGLPVRYARYGAVQESSFSSVSSVASSSTGLGDVRVGLARTLLREAPGRPDLIGRITWDTNTGSTGENGIPLGSGFNELRTSLTAIKRQDPVVFIGGLTWQRSFAEDGFRPGNLYGANLGVAWALSPETSMRFALAASWQENSRLEGESLSGSSRTRGLLQIGGSTLLRQGLLMNLSLGVGLTRDAEDVSLSVSFPLRFQDRLF